MKRESARDVRRRTLVTFLLLLAVGCGAGGEDDADAGRDGGEAPSQERSAARPQGGPQPAAGTAWVIFGSDTVKAEVASTPEQRSRGLMYRDDVPPGTGMLFVFSESRIHSFWMQNTYVPLDIAFLDGDFRVVDIQQMEPLTEDFHESRAPALYALEVPKGWFADKGISVGDRPEVVFASR